MRHVVVITAAATAGVAALAVVGGLLIGGSVKPGVPPGAAPADPAAAARELMDDAPRAKGKAFVLPLAPSEIDPAGTLRDHAGRDVLMTGRVGGVGVRVVVTIPAGLAVPNARWGDTLTVAFDCTAGDLARGNVATKIERRP